jgi:hypothetical protein
MKSNKQYIRCLLIAALLLPATACEQIDLFMGHTEADIPVNVVIHYPAGDPEERLPSGMDVYWFADRGGVWSTEFSNRNGGRDYLYADIFTPLCLDYDGNENLLFRGNGTREDFEAYNRPPDSRPLYCDSVTPLPGETVVLEAAAPHAFYVDAAPQRIDAASARWNDTLTVHFYPQNVLREYSFLIYSIEGAQNIVRGGGAISGMSASYRPAAGTLSERPSTILFTRVEAIRNGQSGRRGKPWTDTEKALFAAKNPHWDDPETGWTGDWVIGYFSTFGPVDLSQRRYRLTLEAYSTGNNYYYGAWGYWHGEWEDDARPESVRSQLTGATGTGTPEERLRQQALWRKSNGGFDIVLDNDGHLPFIPDDAPSTEGGFDLSIDDWGDIVDVQPAFGGASARTDMRSAGLHAAAASSYTAATLPGFVVNGIWKKDAGAFERFFNEQYVYLNENGRFEYQPLRYWPREGENIKFQAYAPLSPAGLTGGLKNAGGLNDTPDPVITYTMPLLSSDTAVDHAQGVDLLVAVQESPLPPASPDVRLNFRHAFARLQVQVRTEAAFSDRLIKLNGLTLGWLNTSGTLTLKPDNDGVPAYSTGIPANGAGFRYSGAGKVLLWENRERPARYIFVSGTDDITAGASYADIGTAVYILPQEASEAEIHLTWSVYDTSKTGILYLLETFNETLPLPAGFAFEAGRSYRFRISLPADAEPPWGTFE